MGIPNESSFGGQVLGDITSRSVHCGWGDQKVGNNTEGVSLPSLSPWTYSSKLGWGVANRDYLLTSVSLSISSTSLNHSRLAPLQRVLEIRAPDGSWFQGSQFVFLGFGFLAFEPQSFLSWRSEPSPQQVHAPKYGQLAQKDVHCGG